MVAAVVRGIAAVGSPGRRLPEEVAAQSPAVHSSAAGPAAQHIAEEPAVEASEAQQTG